MKKTIVVIVAQFMCMASVLADPVVRNAIGALPVERPKASAPEAPPADGQDSGAPMVVKRAQFTRALQDREPVDSLTEFESDTRRIYFFTEVAGLAGRSITHRWEHEGTLMHEQRLDILSARFRTYSSKEMTPSARGKWTVSVIDDHGNTLETRSFTIGNSDATASTH